MVALIWLRGLITHRADRVLANVAGVGIAVALLASIGTFLSVTTSQMTARAVEGVATDWQVEIHGAGAREAVLRTPGVVRAQPVTFAATSGLQARTGDSVQTTGAGQVVGLP